MDTPVASLEGVTVDFGASRALDSVNLTVGAGERVAIVGASGAGKTTLLRVIAGLVLPSAGRASVLGLPTGKLAGRRGRETRRRIGFIHQDLALVDALRVVHNVNAGLLGRWSNTAALRSLLRPADPERAREALARVGVSEKLWARTGELSGGQRQRVAIARTLVQDPDLVLADEPAANLDPPRAREVAGLLVDVSAAEGRALVVTLHNVELALAVCERVVGLRDGRLCIDVPAKDVTAAQLDELYAPVAP